MFIFTDSNYLSPPSHEREVVTVNIRKYWLGTHVIKMFEFLSNITTIIRNVSLNDKTVLPISGINIRVYCPSVDIHLLSSASYTKWHKLRNVHFQLCTVLSLVSWTNKRIYLQTTITKNNILEKQCINDIHYRLKIFVDKLNPHRGLWCENWYKQNHYRHLSWSRTLLIRRISMSVLKCIILVSFTVSFEMFRFLFSVSLIYINEYSTHTLKGIWNTELGF